MKTFITILASVIVTSMTVFAMDYSPKDKIGLSDVVVTEKPVVTCNGTTDWWGCTHPDHTIDIKSDITEDQKMRVFWHEVGHELFNNDNKAKEIFSKNNISPEYFDTRDWKENAAEYTSLYILGEYEDNEQYNYLVATLVRELILSNP